MRHGGSGVSLLLQAAGLASGLMAALFSRTDKSFRMRLSAALSQSTGALQQPDDLTHCSCHKTL